MLVAGSLLVASPWPEQAARLPHRVDDRRVLNGIFWFCGPPYRGAIRLWLRVHQFTPEALNIPARAATIPPGGTALRTRRRTSLADLGAVDRIEAARRQRPAAVDRRADRRRATRRAGGPARSRPRR